MRRRFAAMLRRRSNLGLSLSVAVLAAAVLGVLLGHGAIAEINPIHFQGAPMPPQGIDPATIRPPRGDGYAQAYGWQQGYAARDFDCRGNCDALEARRAAAEAIAIAIAAPADSGPYWRDATPAPEPAPWPPGETGSRALSVERYTHYPVEDAPKAEADDQLATVPPSRDAAATAPDEAGKK